MNKMRSVVAYCLLAVSIAHGEMVFIDFGNGTTSQAYTQVSSTTQLAENLVDNFNAPTSIKIERIDPDPLDPIQSTIDAHDSFVTGAGTIFTDEATTDGITGNFVEYRITGLQAETYDFTFYAAAGQRTGDVDTDIAITGTTSLTETLLLNSVGFVSSTEDTANVVGMTPRLENDTPTITLRFSAKVDGGSFHMSAMKINGRSAVPECSSFLCLGLCALTIAGVRRYRKLPVA